MAKIKVKKELKPKEFLKHLLEQEETEVELDGYTFNYNEEHYSFDPEITTNEVISYNPNNNTYTVEIEEEIDEDTVLPTFVMTFLNFSDELRAATWNNTSIKSVEKNKKALAYHLLNEDGTMTLIWKDGEMVE